MPLSSEQIVTQFNRAAHTYDDVAGLQRVMADRLLEWFLQGNATHQRPLAIADLGCGTGYLIEKLLEHRQSNVTGFDLAYKMLEATSKRLSRSDHPEVNSKYVRLVEADLQSLPTTHSQFDIVFSNAAIQWCDSETAIAEMKRVLHPGGQTFVSTFGPRTLEQWVRDFARCQSDTETETARIHTFEPLAQLKQRFEEQGFSILNHKRIIEQTTFKTIPAMLGSIRKLGASNAQADRKPIAKSTYRDLKNIFQETLQKNGQLELTFETILIHAQSQPPHLPKST